MAKYKFTLGNGHRIGEGKDVESAFESLGYDKKIIKIQPIRREKNKYIITIPSYIEGHTTKYGAELIEE